MKKCKLCSNRLKSIKREHTIRTRNPHKPELVVENLQTFECTVCDYTELSEGSEHYISLIRQKARNEINYEDNPQSPSSEEMIKIEEKKDKNSFSLFKDVIRKWID